MADLITAAQASALLELTDLQAARLPTLVTAASEVVRRWCGRDFTRATYDERYRVGQDRVIVLRQRPVNGVSRVAAGRALALTIANGSTSVQRATVQASTTGDVDAGLVVTGITLRSVASGVTTATALLFADYPTITALAAAVNSIGSGWVATVDSTLALWPSADLVGSEVAQPATGGGAVLELHAQDLEGCTIDRKAGILRLPDSAGSELDQVIWGDTEDVPGDRDDVRVVYDAGYDTIPGPVQQACVEVVQTLLSRLEIDPNLSSETDGTYSYVLNTAFREVSTSKAVMALLAPYREYRA